MNRLPRSETLLVLACAAGAAMLAASQFMTMFELTPQGAEPLAAIDAADQHGYATLVLAVFALAMIVVGIGARSQSLAQIAAFAIAASGAVALLIFLISDLPDANRVGTLDDARSSFIDAKAEPVAGFWFELVGSLILAVCGGALATLGPDSFAIGMRGSGSGREAAAVNGADAAAEPSAPRRRARAGTEGSGGEAPPPESPGEEEAEGEKGSGRSIGLPSLTSLPKPKLPKVGRRRKRIGRPNERAQDEERPREEPEESFNWPSRSRDSD